MSVVGGTSQRILGTKKAMRFLSCYASKWPRFMRTSEVWVSPGWIHLHFHLRVLSAGKKHLPGKQNYWPNNGLRPARVAGKLASLNGIDDIGVCEERFSVAVVSSYTTDMPSYTILYISDSEYRRIFLESDRPLDMPSQGRFTGVAVYLKVLLSILPIWNRNWVEALNEIDNLVGVKIDDLFDSKRDGATMMFDSSFERSRLYFTVLQTLRIISEWVHESERELQQLKRDFYANFQSSIARRGSIGSNGSDAPPTAFINEIDKAWEELIAMHSSSSQSLLNRIEKKEEDIKSFRDGLFSATSVREASRATAMNQYILVFTFVTIFYLPLSYASSLFSMDLFTYDSTESSQSSFLISTVTIALVTWAVAAVVLWLVHDDKRLPKLKSSLFNFRWRTPYPQRWNEFKERSEPSYDIFRGV
ncbi:hypothetical protein GGS26DRAFT_376989 [Hypomontagnella submonticulosa]|nr:hypothetical protein GGS26DRAFT_376989 [Hypomontagnella submonticulosa]